MPHLGPNWWRVKFTYAGALSIVVLPALGGGGRGRGRARAASALLARDEGLVHVARCGVVARLVLVDEVEAAQVVEVDLVEARPLERGGRGGGGEGGRRLGRGGGGGGALEGVRGRGQRFREPTFASGSQAYRG